ncbi:MAG: KH domain-containing protein [Clostridia bacterium]|nr:KH domain-containing protein [Clostridia bacterium]
MIREAFGTADTIEEAKEIAVANLAAPEDVDVTTEIVALPEKKILGLFGGSPAKVRAFYEYEEAPYQYATDYLKEILEGLGMEVNSIDVKEDEENVVRFSIDCGDNYGIVVGRRGETLDSIQYLLRLVVNKNSDDYKRVSVNVGSYREKREGTLQNVAKKVADKVKKYGRRETLEPMNPYERRIIHTTIQGIEGVTSRSVGMGDSRRVVIELEEGFKPLRPSRRNDNRRYNNNNNTTPAEPRERRSDFEGSSLYGKIEIK